jgi:hypothetical protein
MCCCEILLDGKTTIEDRRLKTGLRWENRILGIAVCIAAGMAFLWFSDAARGAAGGTVLPLDDAYIHLQYARQIAAGQPFVYNPGESPTSGATSLLYPFLLASGALFGLRDLSLGVWALVIGVCAYAASIFLVYRIGRVWAGFVYALAPASAFGISGLFAWHAMSGMETMLATCFSLALLYGVASGRRGWVVWAAVLLAITRPEGAVGALLASGWLVWDVWRRRKNAATDAPLRVSPIMFLVPLLAIGVQPLLNLLVTGSLAATGGQAKSLLSAVAPMEVIVGRVVENFARMWREWLLPDGQSGMFIIPLLAVVAGVGIGWVNGWRSRQGDIRNMPDATPNVLLPTIVFVALWLVGTAALISTLDTAFWHFKRYQIPLMALFFPLAAWGAAFVKGLFRGRAQRLASVLVSAVLIVSALMTVSTYSRWVEVYALNVGYVAAQPLAMANWLAENAPADARAAVHDVGMMRYMGGHTTLDMVGLTTAGAASSWRQGPGAVGEWLVRQRPDLIVAYGEGHGLGLNYFLATDLYGEVLATYSVQLDPDENVALAAATQGIYRPRWETSEAADVLRQESLRQYYDFPGVELIDSIDVADLADEAAHDYAWQNVSAPVGFPTEFFQFNALDCADRCVLADGGRRINGEESFTVRGMPGRAMLLVSRVQAAHPGEIDIYADDVWVGRRVLPFLPGEWYELITHIPPELVDDETRIRIVPRLPDGDYMPYQHWVYGSSYPYTFAECVDPPQAYYQDGRFSLNRLDVVRVGERLDVTFNWMNGLPHQPQAEGDYFAFAHLYGDPDAPPVAQVDRRPVNGTLPPGNWLPGMLLDTFMLDLSGVPPGRYRLAVGLYDPYSFARLQPTLAEGALPQFEADADGRLWVGEVVINPSE